MPGLPYRPELDGLRAIAVYLVLLFHAGMVTLEGGFVGVDLFFVLSGFLVTAVILDEVTRSGRFELGTFYARRVRRLLPAAVLVILATGLVQLLVASSAARAEMLDDARAALLYVANWHFIGESRDYFAHDTESSPYLHFWSLAIEEQFYILYPLVVLAALRFSARPIRALALLLAGLAVGSAGLQVWWGVHDPTHAYYATETRAYQLAVGALCCLAVGAGRRAEAGRIWRSWGPAMSGVGLVLLLAVASRAMDLSPSARGLVAAVASGLLVAGVWSTQGGWFNRLLARPAPRYLGQISYGTYLWHWPVLLVLGDVFSVRPLVLAVLAAAISTGLAALSFVLVEHPVRKAPVLVRLRWSAVGVGLATSVAAAVVVVPLVLESQVRPALAAGAPTTRSAVLEALDRAVPEDLDLAAASGDTGVPPKPCTAEEPDACRLVKGTGAHVLLVGDSQAQMYIPALEKVARAQGLTFSANVQAACPWQVGQVNLLSTPDEQAACEAGRETFYADVLPELDVDVVLAIGLSRSEPYWASRLGGIRDGESLDEFQTRTTRTSVDRVTGAGPDLVIAKSMLGTGGYKRHGPDPLTCLARADKLADCAVLAPRQHPLIDSVYDVVAADRADVATVDPNALICPGYPVCSPVLEDTVVWRDSDHVTAAVLTRRADQLWRMLRETGLLS
ncbi:acyltransferase family protein [Nocardioides sp.]|uniref:acyltransferase family protein n=1 Tax=Nocardioides sp. TaxID=35761 RepID=UPI002C6ABF49|nr:acyltransferase family protein [Nocardioides sp.]HSX69114.1 acyltransferase family protein [Nocardioides sp.]